MTPSPLICKICGNEIESGARRTFDETTRRVITVCGQCSRNEVQKMARRCEGQPDNRAVHGD